VQETLDQMAAALRSNNTVALATLYSDDYTAVSTGGYLVTKTSRLESITSGLLKYQSYNYEKVKIRLYGNTAVVNATIKIKIRGQEDNTYLTTFVLIKDGEHWQIVSAQSTSIVY